MNWRSFSGILDDVSSFSLTKYVESSGNIPRRGERTYLQVRKTSSKNVSGIAQENFSGNSGSFSEVVGVSPEFPWKGEEIFKEASTKFLRKFEEISSKIERNFSGISGDIHGNKIK